MELEPAIEKWTSLLGSDRVSQHAEDTSRLESATFATDARVLAILKAETAQEVSEIFKIANNHKVPVYSISTGKNYGYGSRVPTRSGSVVLDLSMMNKIVNYDEKYGTITVQPGVTFGQVFEYLNSRSADFVLSGTGAPSAASLIGNTSERGIGKGLASNRSEHVSNFEIILPSGEVMRTGLGRYKNARAKGLTNYCAGPLLDGLFTQSNLGVVTEMTFWLTAKPRAFTTFTYMVKDEKNLPKIVDAIRRLKQRGVLRSSTTLFNSHRTLGLLGKYPWDLHDGKSTLPDNHLNTAIKRVLPFAVSWYGDGALFCDSRAQARAELKIIKKELKGLVYFFTVFKEPYVSWMDKLFKIFTGLFKLNLENPAELFYKKSLYLGYHLTDEQSLGSTYVRKQSGLPTDKKLDPDRDKCGTYWMGPAVPCDGAEVDNAIEIINRTIIEFGYEPAMTLQFVSSMVVDIIVSIGFDREIPGEDEKAKNCHDTLLQRLAEQGYYPYRLGIQSFGMLPESDDYNTRFMRSIKATVDPNGVCSPGRYEL